MAAISFCCFRAVSVDVIDPEECIVEDKVKLRKLIEKLKDKLKSIGSISENSNDIIKSLAEDPEDYFDNVGLLKNFHLEEILGILQEFRFERGISNGVAKILKEIYYVSIANDPNICKMADFLKENVVIFQNMFGNIKNQKNKAVRKVELIKQKLKKFKKLNNRQQIIKLTALLQDSVFIFTHIQGVLDQLTLRRLDDYLKFKGIQLDIFFPGYIFTLIKSKIDLIRTIIELQNRIVAEINFLNTQASTNFHNEVETSGLSKNMLISCYSPQLCEAALEYTVELICNSYGNNQQLQEKLIEIGLVPGKNNISTFLSPVNFNRLLENYFSEDPIDIDDLVDFFLDCLQEKIDRLPSLIKNQARVNQKDILLKSFRSLELMFEDL